ncbi:MAG: hypothetical protein PHU12_01515 [Candidatus Aenigmarchaeota archaeon]|nr:hypothetical protein [Candidatus Aenigmarchaeota archaeon]
MNREKKKQLIAAFMLVIFFGSTFAIAASYVFPSEKQEKLIFDEPLQESDEAYFFKQNKVVVRVYYDEPSDTIDTLAMMINRLNSKMMLERININQYSELYDYMKDRFPTSETPMILIRGSTEIYLNGEQTEDDLFEQICSVYFEEIDECII